tara:strand:- start:1364 stop:2530 length:1167 start_codon:yes stop_codon:yes gene_type:complete
MSILQNDIFDRLPEGHIGEVATGYPSFRLSGVSSNGQVKQVSTITVTANAVANYVFVVDGVTYTWAEPTATSTTTVATNIKNFWNDTPSLRGIGVATSATNVVTITGDWPGISFALSDTDARITTATGTAAANAGTVNFGRAVCSLGYPASTGNFDRGDTQQVYAEAGVGLFTAQADTWTLGDPGAGIMFATLRIVGLDEDISVSAAYTTNLGTTIDRLDVALNQALVDMGYNAYVVVTNTATTLIFTAAIDGVEFSTIVGSDVAAAHSLASNKAGPGSATPTSFYRSFRGISERSTDQVVNGDPVAYYPSNQSVTVVAQGDMWVSEDGVTLGGQVYVDLSAGNEGLFNIAAGADRLPLPRAMAEWVRDSNDVQGEDIAKLRLKKAVA